MINPLLLTDGYKLDHRRQYPSGTNLVYSNFTPRSSRIDGVDSVVLFGLQYFIKQYLIQDFQQYFFEQPKDKVLLEYQRRIQNYLGENQVGLQHIADLHDLGYLPIEIKSLPEGAKVPIKVPMFVVFNTHPDFFWLTNYLETIISNTLWQACTSATIAHHFRHLLDTYAQETSDQLDFVNWQGHDFSMRGMSSLESALLSGSAHLLSFTGTDTLPAIDFIEQYYDGNSDIEIIGGSVAATEHSVMSMGTQYGEKETFQRLITEVYPSGVVSIVSDTWDLWTVLSEYLPALKDEVLNRDGKVVIRPDSGDPVAILCGNPEAQNPAERKGVVECLYDLFGGKINTKGYIELDAHIGAIYGDSITFERAENICKKLKAKGFASTNVVLGIGSFTYQYNTRDTFGFAMKATYGEVNGEGRSIFKNPITDNGMKKSAKGLLRIDKTDGVYTLTDQVNWKEEAEGELKTVFRNGVLTKKTQWSEIKNRLNTHL